MVSMDIVLVKKKKKKMDGDLNNTLVCMRVHTNTYE